MREDKLFQERKRESGDLHKSPENITPNPGLSPASPAPGCRRGGAARRPGAGSAGAGTPAPAANVQESGKGISGTGLEVPEFFEAHVTLLRDDDVVEHPYAEDRSGLDELPGDADVLGGGFQGARRMVVGQDD